MGRDREERKMMQDTGMQIITIVFITFMSYMLLSVVLLLASLIPVDSEIYNWPWKLIQAWRLRKKYYDKDIELLVGELKRSYTLVHSALRSCTASWLAKDPISYARALGILQRKVGSKEITRYETRGYLFYKNAIFIRTAIGGQTIVALESRGPVLYCVRVLYDVPTPEITLHQIFLWDRPKEFRRVAKRYPL